MEFETIGPNTWVDAVRKAVLKMESGGVIIYPAEKLYALGADATNPDAVKRIFDLKGRPPDMPLPVMVQSLRAASEYAEFSDEAQKLAEAFWPGMLTLVLKLKKGLPKDVTAGGDYIGVRVPGNALARKIARGLGRPVIATSANRSGDISGTSAKEAAGRLCGEVGFVMDVGILEGPPGSTVAKVENGKVKVLRPGTISDDELNKILKEA